MRRQDQWGQGGSHQREYSPIRDIEEHEPVRLNTERGSRGGGGLARSGHFLTTTDPATPGHPPGHPREQSETSKDDRRSGSNHRVPQFAILRLDDPDAADEGPRRSSKAHWRQTVSFEDGPHPAQPSHPRCERGTVIGAEWFACGILSLREWSKNRYVEH